MRTILGTIVLALSLSACGSGGGSAPRDAGRERQVPNDVASQGCDEATMGEDYCIRNSPGGNGTVVARQNPVPYQTCKQ